MAMVIGAAVDWDECGELLTGSYCVAAPKKLATLLDRRRLKSPA